MSFSNFLIISSYFSSTQKINTDLNVNIKDFQK